MSAVTIRFEGIQDEILNALVEMGVARTKSEAIRMALLNFGMDMGIVQSKRLLTALRRELRTNPISPDEVRKRMKKARHESVSG